MTRSPSTTSRAVSVMLEPTSPGSLSTVTTSSSATFSCLPPQRTIAYTRELSLSFALPSAPRNSGVPTAGSLDRAHGRPRSGLTPDRQGYQTSAPTRTQAVRLPDLWWRARGTSDGQGVSDLLASSAMRAPCVANGSNGAVLGDAVVGGGHSVGAVLADGH